MNADCRLKSGFTLIELLTAISVIAVLSSLLLSAAFMAKQRSSRGGCISNVRQLQLGWTMYADENDGRLAINTAAWKGVWLANQTRGPVLAAPCLTKHHIK
jgi:prepilin-type N-terminal cleavage/methylation domain-containing protein